MRALYLLGVGYLGVCLFSVVTRAGDSPVPIRYRPMHTPQRRQPALSSGQQWFAAARPSCNALDLTTLLRRSPPPSGSSGAAFHAGCLALAGQIDKADALIAALPARDQPAAAGVLFDISHPVADSGDDRSAGPMMRLVLKYWPQNYMALYHAGMSECILGDRAAARDHLTRFLSLYHQPDGFRAAAERVLRSDIDQASCREAPG